MTVMLVGAVIASMAGLLVPPVLNIALLRRRNSAGFGSSRPAFAPD